jgi:hypothetical protein
MGYLLGSFFDSNCNSNGHTEPVEITGALEVGMEDVSCLVEIFCPTGIAEDVTATINGDNYYLISRVSKSITYQITFGTIKPQVPDTIEITDLDTTHSVGTVLDTTVNVNSDKVTCELKWVDANNLNSVITNANY